MLIKHIKTILPSHKNCGCYGNRNNQNVAPVGDLYIVAFHQGLHCLF